MNKQSPGNIFFSQPDKLGVRAVIVFLLFYQNVSARDYFQQELAYTIHVNLNDKNHELSAFEELNYKNNSPDTLEILYFHLWPNAYKDESTPLGKELYKEGDARLMQANPRDFGWIDSLDFEVDEKKVNWSYLKDRLDVCLLRLNQALLPGQSIRISTPFHVKIPSAKISRLGHTNQSYFITQWYPKPAVYDHSGWNYFSYADQGEFYGEFGSFDVFVSLPENYIVGATGDLIDGEKELDWLTNLSNVTRKMKTFPMDFSYPPSSNVTKTLHYHSNLVHDFAWFADKRWHVLKDEVQLPASGKRIVTWAMFTNAEAIYWLKAPEYMHDALLYYSNLVGEYPYNQITAVDVMNATGNGMEYPNVVAIGNYGSAFELDATLAHEVGHNWFYGILGSNERRHPWMDEGINNFYEKSYTAEKYDSDSARKKQSLKNFGPLGRVFGINTMDNWTFQRWSYLITARENTDQSPDLPSEIISVTNYHKDVYRKSSMSLRYLKTFLGDSLFNKSMHRYYSEWKFRHPMPSDLQSVFEHTTATKLDWFFEDLIGSTKKMDLAISSIHATKHPGEYLLTVKNKAGIAAPFSISGMKGRTVGQTRWMEPIRDKQTILMNCTDCDAFRIDADEKLPEIYRNNNFIRTKGIFKRIEKVQIRFPGVPENANYSQLFYSPVAGWNQYNGFMAGIATYNIFIPEKKLEYVFMPLYAFRSRNLAGGGNVCYHLYPQNSPFTKITLQSGISRYAYQFDREDVLNTKTLYYTKFDSKIKFLLNNQDAREHVTDEITLRHLLIKQDLPYIQNLPLSLSRNYFQVEFNRINTNPFYAYSQLLSFTMNKDFLKTSLETNNFLSYGQVNKGFHVRCFAGYTSTPSFSIPDYRLRLSGNSGLDDYLFDEIFPGRSESSGILAQQFVVANAGFKIPTSFYKKANQWMLGLNLSTTLPGIIPFRLAADIGTYNDAKKAYPESQAISFETGIELPILNDIFTVYFPLSWSKDIQYIIDQENLHYGNLVRFELHLKKLNPFELLRKFDL